MSVLWDQLLGHKQQKQCLQEALRKERLAPVLLFSGPPGVGKRLCALALAQALICCKTKLGRPCGDCPSCLRVEKEKSENLLLIAPQNLGDELKREKALEILDFLSLKSLNNSSRFILVDQVEKMNVHTGNTLLKILEEPPQNSFFVFLTERLSSLLPTLRSRSQVIQFGHLEKKDLKSIIQNNMSFSVSSQKAWLIRAAQGSVERFRIFMEKENLRKKAFSCLDLCLMQNESSKAFKKIEEDISDKEKSLTLTWFWQQIFRDLSFYKAICTRAQIGNLQTKKEENFLLHFDQKLFFHQMTHQYSIEVFIFLKQLTFQLERDVLGHVNRPLSFKNYLIQIQNKKWKIQTV